MSGPVTILDLEHAKQDTQTISDVTNGAAGTVTSRLGLSIKTLTQAIMDIGFSSIVTWAPSTLYNDFTKLIIRSGVTYTLKVAHTSTSTFDASKFTPYFPGGLGTSATTDKGKLLPQQPTNLDIRQNYEIQSRIEAEATLSSDNITNKHRIYEENDGVVDKPFSQVWNVERSTTKTYVAADGLIKTAPVNVLPVSYDPTSGRPIGRLIEQSRTNLLSWTEDFSQLVWGKARVQVTSDAIKSPDGLINGDKLFLDTTNNTTHILGRAITVSTSTTYSTSIYAKKGEIEKINLRFASRFPAGNATFNLSTGEVSLVGAGIATMTSFPDGWYRCVFTQTSIDSGADSSQIFLIGDSGVNIDVGDGVSGVYIWGAQLEVGLTATSYIPAQASQVTTDRDDVTLALGGEFNANEFTFYNEFIGGFISSASSSHLLAIGTSSASSAAPRVSHRVTDTGSVQIQVINSSGGIMLNQGVTLPLGINKTAIAIDLVNRIVKVAVNGLIVGITPNIIGDLNGLSKVWLPSSAYNENINHRKTKLLPFMLTDTELQELTTL